jgi:signal transduction histidine kinase
VGIEPEVAERLFDRFFRADASHSRAIDGTGLGLAIVRSIARVHGGTVGARARPGGGSVFTVDLPLLPDEPDSSPNVNDRALAQDVES